MPAVRPDASLPKSVGGRGGKPGWMAKEVAATAGAEALESTLAELKRRVDLRAVCRSLAEQEYGLERQARRYESLFQPLCSPESGRAACI